MSLTSSKVRGYGSLVGMYECYSRESNARSIRHHHKEIKDQEEFSA